MSLRKRDVRTPRKRKLLRRKGQHPGRSQVQGEPGAALCKVLSIYLPARFSCTGEKSVQFSKWLFLGTVTGHMMPPIGGTWVVTIFQDDLTVEGIQRAMEIVRIYTAEASICTNCVLVFLSRLEVPDVCRWTRVCKAAAVHLPLTDQGQNANCGKHANWLS